MRTPLTALAALIVVGAGVFWYWSNKQTDVDAPKSPSPTATSTIDGEVGEEDAQKSFKMQPAETSTITQNSSGWTFALDILSPSYLAPSHLSQGCTLATCGLFVNQNPKIRNFLVTKDTKTYKCGNGPDGNLTGPDVLIDTTVFVAYIQNRLAHDLEIQTKYPNSRVGGYDGPPTYTAYFDIAGDRITAIYEQCLP